MKEVFLFIAVFAVLILPVRATKHTVSISGLTYSPALLSVHTGDTVTINANISHPLLQVSKSTWASSGTTALSGGFGPTSSNFTFVAGAADTIYYICTAHVAIGMKGRVVITTSSGLEDISETPMEVTVYPNPVTSNGTIKLSKTGTQPVTIMMFNITGQLEQDLSGEFTFQGGEYYASFDVARLSPGLHFILVTEGRNKVVRRFEVVR